MPPQHGGGRLLRLLTTVDRLADLLPELHAQLLTATGGVSSVILQRDGRSSELHPVSGFKLESMPLRPWLTSPVERAAIGEVTATGSPVLIERLAERAPRLGRFLNAPSALIVPVGRPQGELFVVIGMRSAPADLASESLAVVADAIALALQRARLERAFELQRELRELLDAFTRATASNLDVAAGLADACEGAVRLFAADHAELWLHERRTRELVRRATSVPDQPAGAARVSIEDALSLAATTLRRDRAEIVVVAAARAGLSAPAGIAIPLRGRRRALGTLIVEGVRVEPGSASDILARADELGRQLSAAIENAQLLDTVLASRRQMEDVLDAIDDVVVVCDGDLHIVRANEAFAARTGTARSDLIDRALAELVGPELAEWAAAAAATPEPGARAAVLSDNRLEGTFSVAMRSLRGGPSEAPSIVIVARAIAQPDVDPGD